MKRQALSLLLLTAFATAAPADVLTLHKGGKLEGMVTRESAATITIDVGMGEVTLPRTAVARVVRGAGALSEFRSRFEAISPGDLRAYEALARFAEEKGLKSEARRAWARVAALDPRHAEAQAALGRVLMNGVYLDESDANRALGLVLFEGRWITPAEQVAILRGRDERALETERIADARRAAREAEDRARRAEAEAARARADAARQASSSWGYGTSVIVGPHWGGCYGASCRVDPPTYVPPKPPERPQVGPARPPRPQSIH